MLNNLTSYPFLSRAYPQYDEKAFAKSLNTIHWMLATGNTVTVTGPPLPSPEENDVLIDIELPNSGPVRVPWRAWVIAARLHGVMFKFENRMRDEDHIS